MQQSDIQAVSAALVSPCSCALSSGLRHCHWAPLLLNCLHLTTLQRNSQRQTGFEPLVLLQLILQACKLLCCHLLNHCEPFLLHKQVAKLLLSSRPFLAAVEQQHQQSWW